MNGNSVLLDSNAIIAALDGNPIVTELIHQRILFISFITELEVQSYQKLSSEELKTVTNFLGECIIVDSNAEIKKRAVELRIKYKLKLPDAIIAATASYLDLPLISADKAFSKLEEIQSIRFLA